MGVSKNSGTPKSTILIGSVFHYFHHPFWGVKSNPPIFGSTPSRSIPETNPKKAPPVRLTSGTRQPWWESFDAKELI